MVSAGADHVFRVPDGTARTVKFPSGVADLLELEAGDGAQSPEARCGISHEQIEDVNPCVILLMTQACVAAGLDGLPSHVCGIFVIEIAEQNDPLTV
jgi:hypothetical protein